MRRLTFALALFASPALAQTPNLSPGSPLEDVTSPVVCLPIGKTAKGDLVYSMDCRDIPASAGRNSVPQSVSPALPSSPSLLSSPTLPSEKAAAAPERK
jgi:hypothetical protein